MEGTTTGINLYEDVKEVLQSLDMLIQKLARLVTDGATRMAGRNSRVS
jgi:hypothetical protein